LQIIPVLFGYSQTITTGVISSSQLCPGAVIIVPYTSTGSFNPGNSFFAQISNANGSFVSPVTLITNSFGPNFIEVQLFQNQALGADYRIRVMATNPATTGSDNGINLNIAIACPASVKHLKAWNNNAASWSSANAWLPNGLPNEGSVVLLEAGDIAVIPSGFTSNVRRVQMEFGSKLTIETTAVLSIVTGDSNALQLSNVGTLVTNNGTIEISNAGSESSAGILVDTLAGLNNSTTGLIKVNNISNGVGISIQHNSSFTNHGNIQLGNAGIIGQSGLLISPRSQFFNKPGAALTIHNSGTSNGISVQHSSTITNEGLVTIGGPGAINQNGLLVSSNSQWNNLNGATLSVNNTTAGGGVVVQNGSSLSNGGTIAIGEQQNIASNGMVLMDGQVTNLTAGSIAINRIAINDGIVLSGSTAQFTNSGNVQIGNLAPVLRLGIFTSQQSKYINEVSGVTEINNITSSTSSLGVGIYVGSGQYINRGVSKLGNSGSISQMGISVAAGGTFANETGASLEINRITALHAIQTNGVCNFTNGGSIKIGNLANIGQMGWLSASGAQCINQAGASIEIQRVGLDGLNLSASASLFTNAGTIELGKAGPVQRSGINLFTTTQFVNNTTGSIKIDSVIGTLAGYGRGIGLNSTSIFSNAGLIDIGSRDRLYRSGIFSGTGSFTNQATGQIIINNTNLLDGMSLNGTGSFTNHGAIQIGTEAKLGQCGINLNGSHTLNNQATGTIVINRVPVSPAVYVGGASTSINNSGSIKIGNQTTLSDGLVLDAGGKFTNQTNALVEIDNANGNTSGCLSIVGTASTFTNAGMLSIGKYAGFSRRGIDMANGGIFNNQATGIFEIFSNTVKDNDFRAANLAGNNTRVNNAGIMKIRLKAPAIISHGLVLGSGSGVSNLANAALDLIVND
jgi:hypothetical protein